jgi:hypothetical protein
MSMKYAVHVVITTDEGSYAILVRWGGGGEYHGIIRDYEP